MDIEDSRNALFCDPNAYIQKFEKKDCNKKEIKKIVFQEPYETLPNFYVNNNFTKHNCDCVPNLKHDNLKNQNNDKWNNFCDCDNNSKKHDDKCHNDNAKQNGFSFDIKNILPLLGLFNKGNSGDLSSIVSMLNSNAPSQVNMFSSLFSNKDMLSGIMNLFKSGGLNFSKKQTQKKELKTTDFEIKNYTKVE